MDEDEYNLYPYDSQCIGPFAIIATLADDAPEDTVIYCQTGTQMFTGKAKSEKLTSGSWNKTSLE